MNTYRDDLPPIPDRLRTLPIARGFPVPWFVKWLDGKPELRVADGEKLHRAVREKLCWVCGQSLGVYRAFLLGPMCVINRLSAEPPMHLDCAEFSAKACPFLNGKQLERRENDLPEETQDAPGIALKRNPLCIAVWVTRKYTVEVHDNGFLFRVCDPSRVDWYSYGQVASRQQVLDAMGRGYPSLLEIATQDGHEALASLTGMRSAAERWVPA